MKRAIFLATAALLAMLLLTPMAMGQGTTVFRFDEGVSGPSFSSSPAPVPTPPSGGPEILLPAAALLVGSGILTYAIVRRR